MRTTDSFAARLGVVGRSLPHGRGSDCLPLEDTRLRECVSMQIGYARRAPLERGVLGAGRRCYRPGMRCRNNRAWRSLTTISVAAASAIISRNPLLKYGLISLMRFTFTSASRLARKNRSNGKLA